MRKRFMAILLPLLLAVLFCPLSGAKAETAPYFTFSLDRTEASAGDLVRVRVQARASSDPAAGFRARVFYDSDSLSFAGTESSAGIQSGTLETNSASNPVCCVYVCNTDRSSAPSLSGNALTFVFQVRGGAKPGNSTVTADVDQICGYDGRALSPDCEGSMPFRITSTSSSSKAALRDLEPSKGRLSPDFSPDVQDYEMWVPSDVDSVTFSADALDGGTVKVNRRTLHAAGSDTLIVITVTSADGNSKAVYQVTVHREEAPPSSKPESRISASKPASRAGKTGKVSSARPARAGGTVSSGKAGVSPAPEGGGVSRVPQTETSLESTQPEAVPAAGFASAAPAQAAAPDGTVRVVLVQDRMPSFFTGMLAAALCVTVGIALNLWFSSGKPKKQ